MATKYYLIPKELYNGLINVEPENLNIDYEKKQVEKTKKNGKKDVKNVLYNQEHKRYVKMKKELENKPVKVELANGAHLIAPAIPQRPHPPPIPPRPVPNPNISRHTSRQSSNHPSRRTSTTSHSSRRNVNTNDKYETGDEGMLFDDDDEDGNGTLVNLRQNLFNIEKKEEPEFSGYQETPTTSHPIRQTKHYFVNNSPIDKLYQHIKTNSRRFNVTDNDRILNRSQNREIKNSDIKSSLYNLINPTQQARNPPGTTDLLSKIKQDPTAYRHFENAVARRLGLKQQGSGKKIEIKKSFKFRPQLWK